MPLLFTCPHCSSKTLVEDRYAGQSGPCAACGKQVAIPIPERPTDMGQEAEGPDDPGGVVSVPTRKSSTLMIVMLVIAGVVGAGVSLVLVVTLFLPAVSNAREVAERKLCEGRMQQIASALQAYHQDFGQFPPAYIADEKGRPMHSWRVLILPYLNEQGLYEDYDFNQPWDSEANTALLPRMPDVYACPTDPGAGLMHQTSFVVVTGKGTVFPGGTSTRMSDIKDDPQSTALVVERHESNIGWTEPRDLPLANMSFQVDGGPAEIGSEHGDGAHVVMVGGDAYFIGSSTPSDVVQGMMTTNGGEPFYME